MTQKLWFQVGIGILLLMLIVFMFQQIQEVFIPFVIIAQTIFIPLLVGGVLFYLTRPILQWLESKKFPRWASITVIIALLVITFALIYKIIGPLLNEQVSALVENTPEMIEQGQQFANYLLAQREQLPEQATQSIERATNNADEWAASFGTWLIAFLQSFVQGLFLLILAPFFLIYMLKDHEKFAPFVSGFFRSERKTWMRKTLHDLDVTLRSYIQGQLLVSFLVGVMLLIGYLIIGLNYAFLLSLFGMVTNVIPFLGPYLAVIPAIIIAVLQEPKMALYVALIMFIAQQVESSLISPNVMGKALDIHPITVITVILAAGNIAGLWGIILAIPTYAVLKTIVSNLYQKRTEIKHAAGKEIE